MQSAPYRQRTPLSTDEAQALLPGLLHIPLLQALDALPERETVRTALRFFRIQKGHFIFQSGDAADCMYIIAQGHVKIYHNTADGREQIYYIYQEGDFVGGLNVLTEANYLYMGQAIEDCLIIAISKDLFHRHMLHNPAILQKILKQSFDRIRWVEDLAERLSSTNATLKTAALLLRLKEAFGVETPEGIRIDLRLSREEMGNYSGLTRETMTRKLGEFKEMGLIDYVGSGKKVILIKNLQALEAYCF